MGILETLLDAKTQHLKTAGNTIRCRVVCPVGAGRIPIVLAGEKIKVQI